LKYRAEIDGLRALAVVPVILFHAGFEWFGGGFVGVDVFFVISGYLITTILIDDLANGRFSIVNFYERRVRRILPALLAVLAFTLVVSWLIFLPGPHKVVGHYVIASVFSGSNILLYLKGRDYFGLEESNNPLFHTWSLGVEEQYYVAIPLLMLFFWPQKSKYQLALVLTVIALSLGVVVYRIDDSSFNFYMVFSRAWELGFGALAATLKRNFDVRGNSRLAIVGLVLVVASSLWLPADNALLSLLLLIPVVGSFLVIVFASPNDIVGRFLSLRPIVWVGLISYSLYLWHVPLKVFGRYLWGDSYLTQILYFVFLFLIAFLAYRFVERPFRNRKSMSTRGMLAALSSVSLILVVVGVLGHLNGGFPSRSPLFANLQINNGWGLRCNGNTKIIDACSSSATPSIAVLGNSYAMVYVKPLLASYDGDVVQLTQDSCALGYADKVDGVNSMPCRDFYLEAVQTINDSASIDTVILSSPFQKEISDAQFRSSFSDLLRDIGTKRVVVVGPTPRAPFSVGECIVKATVLGAQRSCDFNVTDEHKIKVEAVRVFIEKNSSASFFDVTDVICPSGTCVMRMEKDNAMYIDTGHLSSAGGITVTNALVDSLGIE